MIRSYEKSHPCAALSARASVNGRVPIIAVSATLAEKDRELYMEAGFDGWILKPINFKRLSELMRGIVDGSVRSACLYTTGGWERGGWFHPGQLGLYAACTGPTANKVPFSGSELQAEARSAESERQVREELYEGRKPEAQKRL